MIKAAKRALSLSRITGFWRDGDEIIEKLKQNSNYVNQVIKQSNDSLIEQLTTLQNSENLCEDYQTFLQRLLDNLNGGNHPNPNQESGVDIDDELRKIFHNLLNNVENINQKSRTN